MNDPKNPFQGFDFESMMKAWQENPLVKSVMENDFVKKAQQGEFPNFDSEEIFAAQKKNLDALKAMNIRASENIAEMAKKQSELMSEALKNVQDYTKSAAEKGEGNIEGKLEEAQALFQNAVSKFQNIGESAKSAGEDIFALASKRMQESINELQEIVKKYKA